jgi:hypothetical protein
MGKIFSVWIDIVPFSSATAAILNDFFYFSFVARGSNIIPNCFYATMALNGEILPDAKKDQRTCVWESLALPEAI